MHYRRSTISHTSAFAVSLLLIIGIASLALFLSTCGGGGNSVSGETGPPPVSNTILQFRAGDAYWDRILSVEATVDAVYLVNSAGTPLKVVPVSHRLEFSHLAGTMTPLYVGSVPQGSYTAARVDGGKIHVSYLDVQGKPQEFTSDDSASLTIPLSSFTVGSASAIVSIDFDLARSIAVDPTSQNPPTLNPTFSFSIAPIGTANVQDPQNGKVDNVTGQVTSVSGSSFTVTARDNSSTPFVTDSSTTFAGATLSTLSNMIVKVEGVTQSDNSLKATNVEALENQNGVVFDGLYLGYIGYMPGTTQMIFLAHEGIGSGLFAWDGAMGQPLRLDITHAHYNMNTSGIDMSGINFTAANIGPGAQLRALSSTGFIRGDYASTVNVMVDKLVLEKQCLGGTVTNYQAGPPAIFELIFDANTFLRVLNPTLNHIYVHQQPGTHLMNLSSVNNNDVVHARGLLFYDSTTQSAHLVAERIWK